MEEQFSRVEQRFLKEFNENPTIKVSAPGRINIIGEHTDYNNGFVMPGAVEHAILFALSPAKGSSSTAVALDQNEIFSFSIDDLGNTSAEGWQQYIVGVAAEIKKSGKDIDNFNVVFSGTIPMGSGMSSSAALECGLCFGLDQIFGLDLSRIEMAYIGQKAEHNYVGVKCGIMDQFASVMGAYNKVMMLDCQSMDFEYLPLDLKDYSLLLINSNVHHSLASSEYNVRREQCEEGVSLLKQSFPDVKSLRDVSMDQLESVENNMDPIVYKRCKYIIEENERVLAIREALKADDIVKVGQILQTAQNGMRYEYEITCPEIDFLAGYANDLPQVLGSRMMGGGFGGCTINIVETAYIDKFISGVSDAYERQFNKTPTPIKVSIGNGVRLGS